MEIQALVQSAEPDLTQSGTTDDFDFDFTELNVFATDIPYSALAHLRRYAPVYWNKIRNPATANDGFWIVTRHSDIVEIEKKPLIFSSHFGLTLSEAPPPNAGPPWSMVRDGLTHLDPPDHQNHRQVVLPLFSRRAIAELETKIRAIAVRVLEDACCEPEFDFAAEVALRFPVTVVLGEVLGLPPRDFSRAIYWSDVIVAPYDPNFSRSAAARAVQEIYTYALSLFKSRRQRPEQDIIGILAHTRLADGAEMTEEVFVRYFWSLFTGAFDTTASAISGGMFALLNHPEQYSKLLADPALIPTAIEEFLRWETPTIYFRRTATQDTVIRGQLIKRGERVIMCYAAANRDEEVFSNPDTFDIARKPNDHLAFGYGPHFCLGSNLARAEIRILFEELVRKQVRLKLNGEMRRARSNFQNRIKTMPVKVGSRGADGLSFAHALSVD